MRIAKMNKRGQLQISFGMIFSIIIIIATVGIGIYVTIVFVNMGKCTQIEIFSNSLKEEINKAWEADSTVQKLLTKEGLPDLPSGIEKVCFGNFTQSYPGYIIEHQALESFSGRGNNFFLYPPKNACDMAASKLEHIRTDKFFCVTVKQGEVTVKLSKSITDTFVTISAS